MKVKQGTLHIGVGVLLFRQGKILLGRRIGSHGAGEWAAPGGHLEYGETPAQCACREVAEETGLSLLTLRAGPWSHTIFPERERQYATLFILAEPDDGNARRMEPDKCEDWIWFVPDSLPEPLFAPLAEIIATYGNQVFIPAHWPPIIE